MPRYVIFIGEDKDGWFYYWNINGGLAANINQASWFTEKADAEAELGNIPRKYDAVIYSLVKTKPVSK